MSETYGERLARARDELGLTQEQFAEESGIPLRTLQDIENGKVARPQRKTRALVDAYLGLNQAGQTAEEWTSDVQAFLDILGAYLTALPQTERTAMIRETIQRIAHRP